MTRDYKHKVVAPKKAYQRRSQQQQAAQVSESTRLPAKLFWVAALFLSIGLIGGFFIVKHFAEHGVKSADRPPEKLVKVETDRAEPEKIPQTESSRLSEPSKPKLQVSINQAADVDENQVEYTFYQGLAKTEVVVNVEPLSVKLDAPYFIQAGTFNTHERALKEQRRLRDSDLELKLSSIEYKKRRYYRLRLGPFEDRLELNKKRNELRQLGVDTLLIRQKASK